MYPCTKIFFYFSLTDLASCAAAVGARPEAVGKPSLFNTAGFRVAIPTYGNPPFSDRFKTNRRSLGKSEAEADAEAEATTDYPKAQQVTYCLDPRWCFGFF